MIVDPVLIVNVTVLEPPVTGTLPVPVQPVVAYCAPGPEETGDVTDAVTDVPAPIHPVLGTGVSWEDVTVRKYWW